MPQIYEDAPLEMVLEIISAYPMALLATNGERRPDITRLPVVIPGPVENRRIEELTLYGHMNAKNPHWNTLSDRPEATLVFNGPDGYVSPQAYERDVAAPTWNFVSVHLHGCVTKIADSKEVLQIVQNTAIQYEGLHGSGWDPSDSTEYFKSILSGVRAFRFNVDAIEVMFKLSQEQRPRDRQNVIDTFCGGGRGANTDIGQFMHRFYTRSAQ
ncbi:FMN-binding negative transcriptional regulator [Nocardia sp. NPDC057272]|uniref:FMN-binding negative transcriptional regulator n=1 Tax=Nocardia sp. NPDC057272 TaxID=3346079 RepID=UPI003632AA51